jgi:hypothetical protein
MHAWALATKFLHGKYFNVAWHKKIDFLIMEVHEISKTYIYTDIV